MRIECSDEDSGRNFFGGGEMDQMTHLVSIALAATFLLGAADAAAADGTAAGPGRRPMTVEDLWAMDRVGPPAVSPDGRQVAFAVTRYSMEENEGNSDLWLVPSDGSGPPRRLTWNEKSDSQPAWSPDGRRLAFVSKRSGDDPAQLYILPLDGGEAEPVTDLPVAVSDPRWFPDGKRIAFLASTWPDLDDDFEAVKKRLDERKEDPVKVHVTEDRLVRYWDHWLTDDRTVHIFALDLESRTVTDLLPGWERLMAFWRPAGQWDLAPDGKELAFTANSTDPPHRKLDYDIYLLPLDAAGAEPRSITRDNPASDTRPRYSPDGRYLIYGRTRRPEYAPDYVRLARYDRVSGATMPFIESFDEEPRGWTFTADGGTVLFHAQERGRTHLYGVPVAGGEPAVLARGGTTSGVRAGGSDLAVFRLESLTRPAELMAVGLDPRPSRRRKTAEPAPLTSFNAALLAELDLGRVEDVTFQGAGGDPVQMFVLLPPGFDATRRWPLVQAIHGGPHGAWGHGFHYRWNAALLASPGHVVAMVNFHGSTGFGQAFAESIIGAHADKPFTDIMMATDLLASRGSIDGERLAAMGGSYGGYMVAWILGHTNRFAALIDHAGVYDLMGQFASDWTWGRAANYGAAPWEDPGRVDLWSPSRYAANFQTPTMVIHGEKDYRVPYTQGLNLYGVLTGKGVPARLVVFPEENHWILKPKSARLWWSEVFGWLERHIGAGPVEEGSTREIAGTAAGNPGP
jgi:dipeptidyl aminopeptidase/acylaminoacyl peptidase